VNLPSPFHFDPDTDIMSVAGASELPQHYGSKTSDGELIKRPTTPPGVLASPRRAYHPTYSPERTPVDLQQTFESERPAGLRRRPSSNPANPRRYSGGDYERERPNFFPEANSRKGTIRSRDDGYFDDQRSSTQLRRAEDYGLHPDSYERSRPPRTYRNPTLGDWEKQPSSASKPYFDETRRDYDLERGRERDSWSDRRKKSTDYEESVDGYNYNQHDKKFDFKRLTKEERAEVMRLPWTQWMNSSLKNRKSSSHSYSACKATN
jgi:aquaporin related protein